MSQTATARPGITLAEEQTLWVKRHYRVLTDIAEATGVTVSTVRQHLYGMTQSLRPEIVALLRERGAPGFAEHQRRVA